MPPENKSDCNTGLTSVLDMLHARRFQQPANGGNASRVEVAQPPSVLAMPTKQPETSESPTDSAAAPNEILRRPQCPVGSVQEYVDSVKRQITAGYNLQGEPWVRPQNPLRAAREINAQRQRNRERPLSAEEALNLVLRPLIFAWAPEKLKPGLKIQCPGCAKPTSETTWVRGHRTLHLVSGQCAYVTTNHVCHQCATAGRPDGERKRNRGRRKIIADSSDIRDSLPRHIASMWHFFDSGRILCDAAVMDLVRAMATRAPWAAISDALNESKATSWTRDVTLRYLELCEDLGIKPERRLILPPKDYVLSSAWVRNAYMTDALQRGREITKELESELGDDVLIIDWTHDAAARCGAKVLLNIMDGRGFILMSRLTETCGPYEAQPMIAELALRGVHPRVVYVDSECCGAWPEIIHKFWPGSYIRLDAMHAMMRLTQTVTSTQHPWHARFCRTIADAVYTYDGGVMARLRCACKKEGCNSRDHKQKVVPRIIADAPRIAAAIDEIIEKFQKTDHKSAGALLTPATTQAWANLKMHVCHGCLCDPPGMVMNTFGDAVVIGGEEFLAVRPKRGSSRLEGFHTHQKQWLGPLARHVREAGETILRDGALRWNRKRHREASSATEARMPVYAGGLMESINDLYGRLTNT